ncbi:hypothetical protein Aglo03_47280 [Actinokineospora globicatena]|uniref:Uncharacterized protein n=1 Tax=Actinokineospora globicatena TaxID=103729 RepID=A0A9W6QQP6_9PSEU|nr:hypothetical protein Aglo03_47280 [Actinokineospora globicatena]
MFYYPKINASVGAVQQALLYWDRLVTVAPVGDVVGLLDRRMREVHEAGLYARLAVDRWPSAERHVEMMGLLGELLGRIPVDDLHGGASERFYDSKISQALVGELVARGFAEFDESRLRVSLAVQLCLISVVARDTVAGRAEFGVLHPHTDSRAAFRFAHEVPARGGAWRSGPCWEVNVGALLPVPAHDVGLDRVSGAVRRRAAARGGGRSGRAGSSGAPR